MKLHISMEYRTAWGECLGAEAVLERDGLKPVTRLFPLDTDDGVVWSGDILVTDKGVASLFYRFVVLAGGSVVRREWDAVPRVFPYSPGVSLRVSDHWRDVPAGCHLYSSAYNRTVTRFVAQPPRIVYFERTLLFRVQAPQLRPGQSLALLGDQPPLGSWLPGRYLRMSRAGLHEWTLAVSADGLRMPVEYKYVVIDDATGELVRWEAGPNRSLRGAPPAACCALVTFDGELRVEAARWKAAGVVVPVFSLRGEKSQGIGDFGDLLRMVDWAREAGMSCVQLLPVNDTTQTHTRLDSYPYNVVSVHALHPLYIDLTQLPPLRDAACRRQFRKRCLELNSLPQVDYEQVDSLKWDFLRRLYRQELPALRRDAAYRAFLRANEDWLLPYCVFCALRDEHGSARFAEWPSLSVYNADEARRFARSRPDDVGLYAYVQYQLDAQLSRAADYARARGVFLKGDIPIGVSPHSVEVWTEPQSFHTDAQAGAPPDDFSANGQNWGFPTYDWDRMERDGFSWWTRRLRRMSRYFDAYRIDHVLGFFRIWEIPSHSVHALLGRFSPSLPMSVDEIEAFGLRFQERLFTEPYITDAVLEDVFGPDASLVRHTCLERRADGTYALLPAYATQRLVERRFRGRGDEESVRLRDGLYQLVSNVLFLPDPQSPGLYHPRVGAMGGRVFPALLKHEREAFARLYEHYFYHRHDELWRSRAMRLLPALASATSMLVCAEDLGMVPSCVGPALESLRVLTLEIQTMPKRPGREFARLADNPYRSVCTLFTHDMPTLRGWWEENPERARRYYNGALGHDGPAPRSMPGWLCEEVVASHLFSPSMLCLLSLQDWLSLDERARHPRPAEERVNVPADPRHYWRYRMHLTMESLMANRELTEKIRLLIDRANRGL